MLRREQLFGLLDVLSRTNDISFYSCISPSENYESIFTITYEK